MRIAKQRTAFFFRCLFLVTGLCGLLLLQLYLSGREPPLVRIDQIAPMMNFSTVRVRGVLAADARKLRSGSALYMVEDAGGVLPVFLICPPEKELPKAGCRVTVEGNLSIGAGHNIRLRAFSEEQVMIEPAAPVIKMTGEILLADVTADRAGEYMTVYGRASRLWSPRGESKAPHRIILSDASGVLEIVHWLDLETGVAVGDEVQVSGRVGLYQGKVQLKVPEAAGIVIRSTP
jgi:hypothetical protein